MSDKHADLEARLSRSTGKTVEEIRAIRDRFAAEGKSVKDLQAHLSALSKLNGRNLVFYGSRPSGPSTRS